MHGWRSSNKRGSKADRPDKKKKNPKFFLKLFSNEPAKVKISITRPEKEWKGQCSKDTIGSMIGFYLMVGSKPNRDLDQCPYHDGKPWTESPFVPMHEVSTPGNFYLDPLRDDDVYTIMPCTFEPGKKGTFFVSIMTDAEFSLKRESVSSKKR